MGRIIKKNESIIRLIDGETDKRTDDQTITRIKIIGDTVKSTTHKDVIAHDKTISFIVLYSVKMAILKERNVFALLSPDIY